MRGHREAPRGLRRSDTAARPADGHDQPDFSPALRDAILAANAAGVLFVVAAGNSELDQQILFPASYNLDNTITVAATDPEDQMVSWSNYGELTVELGAPGYSIRSTVSAICRIFGPPPTTRNCDGTGYLGGQRGLDGRAAWGEPGHDQPGFSPALRDAILAANAAGVLFVAAAGNSELDLDQQLLRPLRQLRHPQPRQLRRPQPPIAMVMACPMLSTTALRFRTPARATATATCAETGAMRTTTKTA